MALVVSMGDIEATTRVLEIYLSAVDLNSITLPRGEDFGIKSDDDDVLYHEDALELEAGFGNVIVVDNLPVVPLEKFEKLEGVVRKIYSQIGVIHEGGLWMPVNPETKKTLGYCFIEFNTTQEAELAKEKTNGYKLDKSHIFVVNLFDEIEKYMKIPDEWTPNEIKPYARGYWTESFAQWSSLGTFLATVHRQGAAVWGGAGTFNRLMRFAHPQVKLIDFSPGEKYIITYSSHEPSNPRDMHRVVPSLFDVRIGKLVRDFKRNADDFASGPGNPTGVSWLVFRSHYCILCSRAWWWKPACKGEPHPNP